MLRLGKQKHRLNLRVHLFVNLSDRSFVFKIGSGAQTSQNILGMYFATIINGQSFVFPNLNFRLILKYPSDPLLAFGQRVIGFFV